MRICDVLLFFNIVSEDRTSLKDVFDDTRDMSPYCLFIAIDNVRYIEEAISKGALLVLCNIEYENSIFIPNLKERLTEFVSYFYNNPKNKLKLIGVTGTNGKSTTAYLIHSLIKKSLLITTTSGIKDSVRTRNTTPSGVELNKIFLWAIKKKYKYVIMEISSIAICEYRISSLFFEKLILTNLSVDHLDYHKTKEEYQNSKIDFLIAADTYVYINENEMIRFPKLQKIKKREVYCKEEIEVINSGDKGSVFIYQAEIFFTQLVGMMNIINILSVLHALKSCFSLRYLKRQLSKIEPLKGRMNIVLSEPLVVIDYAHTKMALKCSIEDVLRMNRKRLIVVFGAGGDRDKSKRREYGKIVEENAYLGIVTSDNPRSEDALKIIDEIIGDSEFFFLKCVNRKDAIALAFSYANKSDAILITGKGAETFQIVGDASIKYSDFEEVKRIVNYE